MAIDDREYTTIEELLASRRRRIRRYTPREAKDAMDQGAIMVDIRPSEQRDRDGLVPGAHAVDRNVLEWRLDPRCAHRDRRLAEPGRRVILICDEGYQSSLAAAMLQRFGIDSGDVIGGVQAWKHDGLPLDPMRQRTNG
jgi:rhodanese-related sulfurtransferase